MNDDAMFCPECGTKTTNAQQDEYQSEFYDQQEFIPQSEFYDQPADAFMPEVKEKKKLKMPGKKGKLIIAAVAVVLAGVIAFGFLTPGITNLATVLGLSSQMNEVFEAAKKTVFESESFTVEIVETYREDEYYNYNTESYEPYSYERKGVAYVEIGEDVDSTVAMLEISVKSSNGRTEKNKAGLVDGKLYEAEYGEYEQDASDIIGTAEDELNYTYGAGIDLEDTINEILNGKIDENAIEDIFNTVIRDIIEEMMEDELGESMEIPEYKEFMKLLRRFFVKGLSKDSVEFKKNGDRYEYTVDVSDVIDDFAEFAEKDKKTAGYVKEAADVADGDEDDFYDALKDAARNVRGAKIEGEVKLEGGRLTYFSIIQDYDDWGRTFEVSFSDINKTTVDAGEIKKMGAQ